MKKRPAAFTLIEVLVVLLIISIVAAVVYPIFARAKLSGYRSTTISNLKQIASAQLMYSSDNDNCFALSASLLPAPWPVQIAPYIGKVPVAPFRDPPTQFFEEPGYAMNECLNLGSHLVDDTSSVVLVTETAEFRTAESSFFNTLVLQATDETSLEWLRKSGYPTLYNVGPLRARFYNGGNSYAHVDGSVSFARKENVDPGVPVSCEHARSSTRWRFALQGMKQ